MVVLNLTAAPDPIERKAFEAMKARAEKGEARAQLDLGGMYARGEGVDKDLSKAAKWHRKAAESGLARAQLVLSLDYSLGRGVRPDPAEAIRWLRRAAEQKLPEAQYNLGLYYANGDGAAQDSVEAVKWFRLAAEQDLPDAIYELGRCYFEGTGVPTDVDQAVTWTRKAAWAGFAPAQNRLGECYTKGEGVSTNFVEAYKWLTLSAAQDDSHADEIRVTIAKIAPRLTPEQLAEAQRLARSFKSGPEPAQTAPATPKPEAKNGTIAITSSPGSCELFADGAFVGNTPARLKLPEGNHTIEARKTGYKDYRRQISVTADAELTLSAELEPR
jgi:TPR repeat protein